MDSSFIECVLRSISHSLWRELGGQRRGVYPLVRKCAGQCPGHAHFVCTVFAVRSVVAYTRGKASTQLATMAAVGSHLCSHLHCSDAVNLDGCCLTFVDFALDVGEGRFNLVNEDEAQIASRQTR